MNVEYFLLIYFTYLTMILKVIFSEEGVFCGVKSNPAVFGKNVSIYCKYNGSNTCIENRTRTWTKGQNKDFLMMNGHPTAIAERYKENVLSCSEVELEISNFSSDDLNSYQCYIDFKECELPLILDADTFEYHPNGDEIKTNLSISNEEFSFFLDIFPVYPSPKCTVFYGNMPMKDFLKQKTRRVGHFYQSKLNLEFKASGKICPITANATCKIGRTEISLLKFELKNCSVEIDTDKQQTTLYYNYDDFEKQVSLTLTSTEKTILCILTGICLALVIWSMYRNRTLIQKTYNELSDRNVWDIRRPLLAVLATFGSMSCDILTFTKIVEDNQTLIICFALALLLTLASLVLLSNTNTISIREGVRKSFLILASFVRLKKTNRNTFERFIEKFENCINREQNTIEYDAANTADGTAGGQSV